MDEFIREIQEDLEREKLRAFWARYGKLIISGCVAVILGTAAGVFWSHHRQSAAMERTALVMLAVQEMKQTPADASVAEKLSAQTLTDQTAIANFYLAARTYASGDTGKANALYESVAQAEGVDPALRSLARTLAEYTAPALGAAKQSVTVPLSPDMPFYFTTTELQAWKAVDNHDNTAAIKQFSALRDSAATPPGMRERAGLVAAYLSADIAKKD